MWQEWEWFASWFSTTSTMSYADATLLSLWNPFGEHLVFQFEDYHFTELQSSEAEIN